MPAASAAPPASIRRPQTDHLTQFAPYGLPKVLARPEQAAAGCRAAAHRRQAQPLAESAGQHCCLRHRPRLRLPEQRALMVLSGGGEVELVASTVWSSQAQPVEAQDAPEMGEQHFDPLSLAPRDDAGHGVGDTARQVPGTLVNGA